MRAENVTRIVRRIGLLAAMLALPGCNLLVLNAPGDVAAQQGDLIVYATVLMLIVILPVMALTIFFGWKYRASNQQATYDPDWDHSISLEIVVWTVPLGIIIMLAGLTWVATHRLDPYAPLTRISAEQPIDPSVEPMVIQAVAMDWKWAFIYPDQGIAAVNELVLPVDQPVEFQISSTTVMNAFYIPAMAGMIYGMAGMETELNAVMNEPGSYEGFSANYSGAGFSQMNFDVQAVDPEAFDDWVEQVRSEGTMLDRAAFVELDQPTIDHPVTYFGGVYEGLWRRIVNMCVEEGTLCHDDMMMVDALGGGGIEGLFNREMFAGICTADDPRALLAMLRPEWQLRGEEIIAAIMPPATPVPLQSTPVTGAN